MFYDWRFFSYYEWVFKVLWRREESKRKHLLSISARKRAIDGDIARTRSFSVADNDFNDTSGTVRLCLTTLVKVTTGVLNDQFASRQWIDTCIVTILRTTEYSAGGVENSRVVECHVCTWKFYVNKRLDWYS